VGRPEKRAPAIKLGNVAILFATGAVPVVPRNAHCMLTEPSPLIAVRFDETGSKARGYSVR